MLYMKQLTCCYVVMLKITILARNIEFSNYNVKIRFGDLLKQARHDYQWEVLVFKAYSVIRICIVNLLRHYVSEII